MFETNPGGQDNPTDMPAPDTPEQPEDDDQDEEPQPEPAS
jgi:hypothetical protein